MKDYLCFLVTTLHVGPDDGCYLLRTAVKIPHAALDEAKIDGAYIMEHRAWLLEKLPLHAQGKIVHIDEIFEVVTL